MPATHARTLAFEALGVSLRFPADSWSGVRAADGTVVFALAADQVRADGHGYLTLLWTPARRAAAGTIERASSDERLEHCRLALSQGRAEGFVIRGRQVAADMERLPLRIVASGEKYWARWTSAVGARQAA